MNQIQIWYEENFEMLEILFKCPVIHDPEYRWVRIERFPLPPCFNKEYTKLLIRLPGSSGIENYNKYHFYITKDLKRTDGAPMRHYYERNSYNNLKHKNYARMSFHLKSFKPSLNVIDGDNLVDICQSLYNFLAQKKGA